MSFIATFFYRSQFFIASALKEGTWLVLDSDLPILGNVVVLGVLEISPSVHLLQMKNLIVLGGKVTINNKDSGIRDTPLRLIFEGEQYDEELSFSYNDYFGTKGMLCYGTCDFKASGPANSWTTLGADAHVGLKQITVENAAHISAWPVGGKVIISSTSMYSEQVEEAIIEDISDTIIKLTTSLKYFHRGVADPVEHRSQIGEVMLVDKLVSIEGTESEKAFGARVKVGDIFMDGFDKDHPMQYNGKGIFENINFVNAGQFGKQNFYLFQNPDPTWAVLFYKTTDDANRVESCHFSNTYNSGVAVKEAKASINKNTFYKPNNAAVEALDSPDTTITMNLVFNMINGMIFGESIGTKLTINPDFYPAAIRTNGRDVIVRSNRVAIATGIGMAYPGQPCTGGGQVWNTENTIRGAQFGYMYAHGADPDKGGCEKIKDLDVTHSIIIGVTLKLKKEFTKWISGEVQITDSIVGNSGLVDVMNVIYKTKGTQFYDPEFYVSEVKMIFRDLILYGQTDNFDCAVDYDSNPAEYATNSQLRAQWNKNVYKSSFNTAYIGSSGGAQLPSYENLFGTGLFNSPREHAIFENVEFRNVGGKQYTCSTNRPSYVIGGHHDTKAQTHDFTPIFTKDITKVNVDEDYLTIFMKPSAHTVSEMLCIDMDCLAFTGISISDWDGTLTGDGTGRGALLPNPEYIFGVENVPQKLSYDRVPWPAKVDENGNALDLNQNMPNKGRPKNSACTFKDGMNAWHCTGEDSYQYNKVTIMNMDKDTKNRRIGPLSIITNRGPDGTIDIYNSPPRDRVSRWGQSVGLYKTTVAMGTEAEFFFAGTPPQKTWIGMEGPGYDNQWRHWEHEKKLLVKFYNPAPQILKVAKMPSNMQEPPTPEPITMLDQKPTLSDEPGSYFHDREEQMLYLVLADNHEMYEITVSDMVAMSFGIPPVPMDDFFGDQLVDNIANFFGIPADKIKIVDVVSEQSRRRRRSSTKNSIDFEIELDDTISDAVQAKTKEISDEIQTGNKDSVNGLLNGATASPVEATTVAVVQTPKTEAQMNSYNQIVSDLIGSGERTTRSALVRTNSISEVTEMRLSATSINVDCSKGGTIEVDPVDVSFHDSNGDLVSAGNSNSDWTINVAKPVAHDSWINATSFDFEVVNTGTRIQLLEVNCDHYKHVETTQNVDLTVDVKEPVSVSFTDILTLVITPISLASAELSAFDDTGPQDIDCSIGGFMPIFDLDLVFTDDLDREVFVGSVTEPWTIQLQFSHNSPDFIGGLTQTAEATPVTFSDLDVNCDNYKDRVEWDVFNVSAVVTDPPGHGTVAEYVIRLLPDPDYVPPTTTGPETTSGPETTATTLGPDTTTTTSGPETTTFADPTTQTITTQDTITQEMNTQAAISPVITTDKAQV